MNAIPELVARVTLWMMKHRPIRQWRMNRLRKKRLRELGIEENRMLKGKLTYAGLAVAGVSVVLGWLGVADEAAAGQLVQQGGELAGLLIALYGRWRATQA